MSAWNEEDSRTYRTIADVAVPRRGEMMATLVSAIPFAADESFRVVELGCGEGLLSAAVLEAFPAASVLALDGSASMRAAAVARTARFGARAIVRDFALDSLAWWDLMFGADLVMSALCLHHLNDAKKQYLYKAAADRLSSRGALVIADLIQPASPAALEAAAAAWDRAAKDQAEAIGQPHLHAKFMESGWNHFRTPDDDDHRSALLHHLVWLKQAGFVAAECLWLFAGHAVFGGFGVSRRSA